MRGRTYLDWNATTPLRGEARAAMAAAFDIFGNPSSVHSEGRAARALMEEARAAVAAAVGADAATSSSPPGEPRPTRWRWRRGCGRPAANRRCG